MKLPPPIRVLALPVLLCLLVLLPRAAAAGEVLLDRQSAQARVVETLLRRLDLMPAVAAAKWREQLPVSDPAREQALLDRNGREAAARGLAPEPVIALLGEQFRLAREHQSLRLDHWAKEGCTDCASGPSLAGLRERLDALGTRLLDDLYLLGSVRAASADAFPPLPQAVSERRAMQLPDAADRDRQDALLAAIALEGTGSLARARSAGTLRIGTTGDYAPFTLERDGELSGADIRLGQELARALGLRAVFLRTRWATLAEDLQRGAFDLVLGGVSVTPDRAAVGRFTRSYQASGKTLLVRCEDAARLSSLAAIDHPGVRLIVNPGGTNERFVREHIRQATVRVHPDNREVFREIAEGRADVMVTDDVE
ncbi:MAG: transporter substrate-binding domain-containing protein, partial [Gammaproteobacteria bacterium]